MAVAAGFPGSKGSLQQQLAAVLTPVVPQPRLAMGVRFLCTGFEAVEVVVVVVVETEVAEAAIVVAVEAAAPAEPAEEAGPGSKAPVAAAARAAAAAGAAQTEIVPAFVWFSH